MDRKELMEVFNKRPRIGTLSTANKAGEVNVAVFGYPVMTDENTVVMGLGKNRTYRNLLENPNAVFIVLEPGKGLFDWKGARVYLKVLEMDTSGPFYTQIKESIRKVAGDQAASIIYAAVKFEITEVRPIIDMAKD